MDTDFLNRIQNAQAKRKEKKFEYILKTFKAFEWQNSISKIKDNWKLRENLCNIYDKWIISTICKGHLKTEGQPKVWQKWG